MAFVSFDMAAINFLTTTLEKQDPLVHRSPPRFPSWPPLTRYDQLHRQFSTISLPLTRFLGSPSFPSRPQIFLRPLFFACFPCRRFYTPPRPCVATLSPLQRIKKEIVNWVPQCFHLEKDHRSIYIIESCFFRIDRIISNLLTSDEGRWSELGLIFEEKGYDRSKSYDPRYLW